MWGSLLTTAVTTPGLMEFIEHNWFVITLLVSVIGLVIKMTRQITKTQIDIEQNNKDVKKEVKEIKDDIREELKDIRVELASEKESVEKKSNRQHKELMDRMDVLEDKRNQSTERTAIILEGVEATLTSLKNDGKNGPVTEALNKMLNYKQRKASED